MPIRPSLIWLLALPWAVSVSTSFPNFEGETITYPSFEKAVIPTLGCPNTKEHCLWVQDFVEAMNEAHERRINTLSEQDKAFLKRGHESVEKMKKEDDAYWKDSKKAEWESGSTGESLPPSKEFNKGACGQDDCGVEPK